MRKRGERISAAAKAFIAEAFVEARREGRKVVNFKQLAKDMRDAALSDGRLKFRPVEVLSHSQIGGIWARLTLQEAKENENEERERAKTTIRELYEEGGEVELELQKSTLVDAADDVIGDMIQLHRKDIFSDGEIEIPNNEIQIPTATRNDEIEIPMETDD